MFDIIVKDFGDRAANHILQQLHFLNLNIKKVMETQEEEIQVLVDLKAQLLKAKQEITTKIQTLVDAAANGPSVSAGLQAAIDDLKPVVQQLDDIVPDPAPVVTPDPAPADAPAV